MDREAWRGTAHRVAESDRTEATEHAHTPQVSPLSDALIPPSPAYSELLSLLPTFFSLRRAHSQIVDSSDRLCYICSESLSWYSYSPKMK